MGPGEASQSKATDPVSGTDFATGSLTGIGWNQSGAPVEDALVSLYKANSTTPAHQSRTTVQGLFSFDGLRPQLYRIFIEKRGYAAFEVFEAN
jgi:hypothetical protein